MDLCHTADTTLIFSLLLLSYFEANMSRNDPCETICDRFTALGWFSQAAAVVRPTVELAFTLNVGFREQTNATYFTLLGLKDEYELIRTNHWWEKEATVTLLRELSTPLGALCLA
ncbi:MAG: hypothetical protein ACRD45_12500 [Bryobacteraceae bacterium]